MGEIFIQRMPGARYRAAPYVGLAIYNHETHKTHEKVGWVEQNCKQIVFHSTRNPS